MSATKRLEYDARPSARSGAVERPRTGVHALARATNQRADWRISLLIVLICYGIYLPAMGSYGMFDPWETHYTEVARQFLERGDWLSPHWHNGTGPEGRSESNFWSKPVGSFWMSGLSLKLFGLEDKITLRGTGRSPQPSGDPSSKGDASAGAHASAQAGPDPGEVLATAEIEWAVRLPFFFCGLFGIFCIYLMCTRLFSKRAGVLAALILATSPIYFFITRQAMTDMPYAGLVSGGLALFALAVFGQDTPLRRKTLRLGRLEISWPHATSYYAFVAAFVLFMILMLRVLIIPLLRVPLPLPIGRWRLTGAVWMLPYVASSLLFLWLSFKTRTRNEVYLYTFYMVTGIAGLSKGLVGALQPGLVIFLYLLTSREWRMLTEVALGRGLLLAGSVFAPWWHAMVIRHGFSFWNTLVGTEQLRRLTIGEQAQAKGTWDYYLRQMGYGMFPWIAFLPGALIRAFTIGDRSTRTAQDRARLFCYVWLAATMLLFSFSITKYHHYILPAVAPAAILIAVFLDDILARRARGVLVSVLAAAGVLSVVAIDLIKQPAHWVWLYTYLYTSNWARGVPDAGPIILYALLCGAAIVLLLWPRMRTVAVWALLVVAVGVGGYVLNWHQVSCSYHWGQKYVMQSYYKLRKGPEEQLVAWQFNWRGETWYTAAQVVVAKSTDDKAIKKWLGERTGRRFFFITERSRYASLRGMLPTPKARDTLRIVDDSNVHFVLAEAHL